MSQASKKLRSRAAAALRGSRNGGSKDDKAADVKRAAAFKALAQNDEWLEGEKERSKRKPEPEASAARS
jgi:hypothetical protein